MQTVWNTWSARGWPMSLPEEAVLLSELHPGTAPLARAPRRAAEALAVIVRLLDGAVPPDAASLAVSPLSEPERDQVVWLITMLRCGAGLSRAELLAPGLEREGLFAAYVTVEARRRAAVAAWRRLCRAPTPRTFLETSPLAGLVLPSAVAKVAAAGEVSPARLAEEVARCDAAVRETSRRAYSIEAVLASQRSPSPVKTARALLDPTNPGWWDHALYLPRRVGDLTPNRLRDLLGEEHR